VDFGVEREKAGLGIFIVGEFSLHMLSSARSCEASSSYGNLRIPDEPRPAVHGTAMPFCSRFGAQRTLKLSFVLHTVQSERSVESFDPVGLFQGLPRRRNYV
jgi:hypothetical protein